MTRTTPLVGTYRFKGRLYGPETDVTEIPAEIVEKAAYDEYAAARAAKRLPIVSMQTFLASPPDTGDPGPSGESEDDTTEDESLEDGGPEDDGDLPADFPYRKTLVRNGVTTIEALRGVEDASSLRGIGEERWQEVQTALANL